MATFPGMNNQFAIAGYQEANRRIIRRFANLFYITRSIDPIQVGTATYEAFLMRPSDSISIVMNVEREFVVLLSKYENFDARILKAFDAVYERFDDIRIDKSVRFIVSNDPSIEASIRNYLIQDPEYPVVIPFRYADFASTYDEFIVNQIRSNHLVRDLFGYQSPLRNEYFFFGRGPLIETVLDLHKSGQNSGIFGLRKSGKTSTIFAIQRRAKTVGCRTVLLDCQDPSVHSRNYSELLAYIISEVRRTLSLKSKGISLGNSPAEVSDKFKQEMTQALGEARSHILLLFDEIENISPRTAASEHWRSGSDALLLWQILRSYFQSDRRYRLTFCFVGTNPNLLELTRINGVDNPVYLFAQKIFVPNLSEEDTREMLSRLGYFMGLDFPPAVVSHIHQRFGGHPFFIRQLCSRIHVLSTVRRPTQVSLQICKQAEADASFLIKQYVNEILDSLKSFYPEEHDMMSYLAQGDYQHFVDIARESPAFIEHLLGYGIVVQRGEHFDFAFDAIREAIQARASSTSGAGMIEEQRTEISRRRNRLEEEMRAALFYWANSLPGDAWVRACEECVPKLIDSRGPQTPRQLFSKGQSPLYLIDLLKFIELSAAFGTEHVTNSEIKQALDTVNRLRVDAHSKSTPEGEFEKWQAAIGLLEEVFLPPE
jgi:hypothetical protein